MKEVEREEQGIAQQTMFFSSAMYRKKCVLVIIPSVGVVYAYLMLCSFKQVVNSFFRTFQLMAKGSLLDFFGMAY